MQDLRSAFRNLAPAPGFTAVAFIALALAIGLSAARAAEPVPFPTLTEPDNDHTPPKRLKRVDPSYPAGVNATEDHRVFVAFHVAADGTVKNASAMFNPPAAFANAAVAAVEQWVFEPAMIRGERPVWTQMTVEIWFKVADAAQSDQRVVEDVLAANARMTEAANRLDTDAFFACIVDSDATRIVQDGKLFKTRAEAMAAVRAGSQGVAKVDRQFDSPHVAVLAPGIALLTAEGMSTATLQDGRSFGGRFAVSLVFVLREGEWKLFHGHYSLPNPQP
jgi:TonB family protein